MCAFQKKPKRELVGLGVEVAAHWSGSDGRREPRARRPGTERCGDPEVFFDSDSTQEGHSGQCEWLCRCKFTCGRCYSLIKVVAVSACLRPERVRGLGSACIPRRELPSGRQTSKTAIAIATACLNATLAQAIQHHILLTRRPRLQIRRLRCRPDFQWVRALSYFWRLGLSAAIGLLRRRGPLPLLVFTLHTPETRSRSHHPPQHLIAPSAYSPGSLAPWPVCVRFSYCSFSRVLFLPLPVSLPLDRSAKAINLHFIYHAVISEALTLE